jgi:hypothetical protein
MESSIMQSLKITKQDGIEHKISSNVIKQDRILLLNALIMFHKFTVVSDIIIDDWIIKDDWI